MSLSSFQQFSDHHRNLLKIAIKRYPKVLNEESLREFDTLISHSKKLIIREGLMGNWEAPRHFSTPEDFLPSKAAVILEYYTDKEIQMLEEGWLGDKFKAVKNAYTTAKGGKTGFGGVLAGLKGTAAAGAEAASAALTPDVAVGAMAAQGEAIKRIEEEIAVSKDEIDAARAALPAAPDSAKESAVVAAEAALAKLTAELAETKKDFDAAKSSGFMQSLVGRLYGKKKIDEGYRRNNSRRNLSALAFQDYMNEGFKQKLVWTMDEAVMPGMAAIANNGMRLGGKITADALGNPLVNGHQILSGGHHLASHVSRQAASAAAKKLALIKAKAGGLAAIKAKLAAAAAAKTGAGGILVPGLGGGGVIGGGGGGAAAAGGIGLGTVAAGALGVAAVGAAVAAGVAGSRLKKRREKIEAHSAAAKNLTTLATALEESRGVRNLRRAVRSAVHEGLLRNTNR